MFPSEAATEKAYAQLSAKKELSGKELIVDKCYKPDKPKPTPTKKGWLVCTTYSWLFVNIQDRPINPLELSILALPRSVTEDQLKIIFPTATKVKIPKDDGKFAGTKKRYFILKFKFIISLFQWTRTRLCHFRQWAGCKESVWEDGTADAQNWRRAGWCLLFPKPIKLRGMSGDT